jgi:enoyl-CoA hydratase/carnithine racemase
LLQRVVGLSKACEMTFTGDAIDAQGALACGLVSKVVAADELMPEAMSLAKRIASNSSVVLRMAKRLIREAQHSRLESVLELSAALQAISQHTDDHVQAVDRALESMSRAATEM